MLENILGELAGTQKVFATFALAGTLFFVLRVILIFFTGVGDDHSGHSAGHASSDTAHDGTPHSSDWALRLLSVNTLTAFIMMFGWAGLAASKQFGMEDMPSLACALAAGFLCMVVTGYLFTVMMKLQSPGEHVSAAEAVGQTGSVYLAIPAVGTGKIQVAIAKRTIELDAASENHEQIKSFEKVKVVRLIDSRTVSVSRIE